MENANQNRDKIEIQDTTPQSQYKFKRFISEHKKVVIVALIFFTTTVISLIVITLSNLNNYSSSSHTKEPDSKLVENRRTSTAGGSINYSSNIINYAKADHQNLGYQNYIGLVEINDDSVLLERTEYEWDSDITIWGDWLYFIKNTKPYSASEPNAATWHLLAFNLVTKQYKDIGQMSTKNSSEGSLGYLFVHENYLYLPFDDYKAEGKILRCKLSSKEACVNIETFYEGSGSITILDETNVIAIDAFADGGFGSQRLSLYNPKTKKETKIVDLEVNSLEGGNVMVDIDDSGLIWIYELGSQNPEELNELGEMIRLYAIDKYGMEKYNIPASSFPLKENVNFDRSEGNKTNNEIVLRNKDRKVIFNTDSRTFGAISEYDQPNYEQPDHTSSPEEQKQILSKLAAKLELPESYKLIYTSISSQ